mgnify:CR=1 FL=1
MGKIVFMFPGQGAQYVGMGKDFYEKSPLSKAVFDQASEAAELDLKKLCFEENDLLNKTEYTQVAMVTACLAMTRAVESMGLYADMTAGLSLGEYSAYVASEAMDFEEAVALVQKRGKFMAEAVPSGEGAMYAIIGLDTALVEEACAEATAEGDGLAVPANYNAPGQIVIAGHAQAAKRAAALAKEKGAKLTVPLKVSGPFHTELLQPAAEKLGPELDKMHISPMKMPVYTNVDASKVASEQDIIPILKKQIVSPVRWEQIIRNMAAEGADTFIELGPGKTLNGFVKRTLKGVVNVNVEDSISLQKTMNKLHDSV